MFDILPWKRKKESPSDEFHRQIDNYYDRIFEPYFLPLTYPLGDIKTDPKLDIIEGEEDITVKAEIPGIEAKDFDISIDSRLLTIKGEKKQEKKQKEETYYRIERSYGSFKRTIELPTGVLPDSVDASYKKGVLKIKFRKAQGYQTKKIKVTSG
jgi:HSP20 family protein